MKYKKSWMIGITLLLALAGLGNKYPAAALLTQQTALTQTSPTNISFQQETYDSQAMGGKRTYGVCLPPGYDQNPNQRYPVVFLLHGGDGDQTDWFNPEKGAALKTLEQLYATGNLPPSIIITPDGNDLRGKNSKFDPEYFDGPNGKVGTAIGDELVQLVASRYRTLPNPNFWAIGGLSSGAWGAFNIGLRHLNHFSILFSHSGYFVDESGAQNSPMKYIKTLSPQAREQLRIYLDAGVEDREFFNQTKKFHALLNQLQIRNEFRPFPGTHSWRYWRQHLADSLTFVGEEFRNANVALNQVEQRRDLDK